MNQRTAMCSLRSTTLSFAPPKNGSPRMFFSADRPRGQVTLHEHLARRLLLGLAHADRGPDGAAQILHVLHHAFVARRVEVVARMKAVSATDHHEYGGGVSERRTSGLLKNRQGSIRRLLFHRGPVGALDAHVLEVDAREVQREAALLTTAYRSVEVDELGFGHAAYSLSRCASSRSTF
jgi:hypothetical protein